MPVGQKLEGELVPEVTGFLAMSGKAFDGALMVLGRAVNGWAEGISTDELRMPDKASQYAEIVQDSVAGNETCPMSWVTDCWGATKGYNTKRSAFWRCIRNVTAGLNVVDAECANWSSHLVWSNLYKVALAEGGNPTNKLCQAQLAGCVDLFKLELRTYRPSRLLFLTGSDWADPFLDGVDLQESDHFHYVQQYGRCRLVDGLETQCVVAAHPQGKPEADWVREVVTAFGN
ncbi:MAG: hypothetical protein HLX50_10375 [Alteromonadaceae bacterium]|nr:hypothetical protein [Alteromonadaceae bacterium]